MDIKIRFKDELKCIVECDRSIALGIKEKFSFFLIYSKKK